MENQQVINSLTMFNDWFENNMQPPNEYGLSRVLSAEENCMYDDFASCLVNDKPSELSPTSVILTEQEMNGSSTMEIQAPAAASSDKAAGFSGSKFPDLPIQSVVASKFDSSNVCVSDHMMSLPVTDPYFRNRGLMDDLWLLSNDSIDMENNLLPDTAYPIEQPGPDSNGDLFCLTNQVSQVPNLTQIYLPYPNSFLRSSSFSDDPCFGLERMLNNPDISPNKLDPNVNIAMPNNLNIDTVTAYSPSLFLDSTNPSIDGQSQAHPSTKNQSYESQAPNLHGSHLFGSNVCFPVVSYEACIPISNSTNVSDLNSSFGGGRLHRNFLSDSATRPSFNPISSIIWEDLPNLGGANQSNENSAFTITNKQYLNGPCASNVKHQLPQLPSLNFTTQDQQCLNDTGAFIANDQIPHLMSTDISTQQQQYLIDPSASNVNHRLPQLPSLDLTTQNQHCLNDPGAFIANDQLPYLMNNTTMPTEQQQDSVDPSASNVNHKLPQLPSLNFTTQEQQCLNDTGAFIANDQLPDLMNTTVSTEQQQDSVDPCASNVNHPQLFSSNGASSFNPGSMITEQDQQEFIDDDDEAYSNWLKESVLPENNGHPSLEIIPKSYECKVCDKTFPSTHALGGHMSSHTRLKKKEQKITKALTTNLNHKDFDFICSLTHQMASFAKKNNPDLLMPKVTTMAEDLLIVAGSKRKLSPEREDSGDEEGSSRKIIKLGETEGNGEEPK
ncbi:hypothetical protein Scep_013819 [Stephania cephalantha]|uniref:C2H2-type domain-containing protein n=1 Tax=Stephania cephalantha TaxID=152367 RepID=A0AAP0NZS0_9MAGN